MKWIQAALALATMFVWRPGAEAVPTAIPYSGQLTYDTGALVNDSFVTSVSIYDAMTGGNLLWGPVNLGAVEVENGQFSVVLGTSGHPPLAPIVSAAGGLWLEWTLGGDTLAPRQEVLSVPYALESANAAALGGTAASAFATSMDLSDQLDAYVPQAPVSATPPSSPMEGWLWVNSSTGVLHVYRSGSWLPASEMGGSSGDFGVGGNLSVTGTTTLGDYAIIGGSVASCTGAIEGALRYNQSAKLLELCDGASWAPVQAGPSAFGQSPAFPAGSCAAIKASSTTLASGLYWLDPNGGSTADAYQVYCDLSTAGGGWTMVLNLDTSDGHVMWWANPLWTNSAAYGTVATPFDGDHKSPAWSSLTGASEVMLVVHEQGSVVGWKRFQKVDGSAMFQHFQSGDNVLFGTTVLSSSVASINTGERMVRSSTQLFANHCNQGGNACSSGAGGSPDGDRIGSNEGTPSDNNGGGLGNWHDMSYCCSGSYASKSCNGFAFRTTSEAQAEWCGGVGYFGTDSFAPGSCAVNNTECTNANWAAPSGIAYDYTLYVR